MAGFDIVCEIEPPTRPDLSHVRRQIEVLAPVAAAFLVPDNHLGRATVSSVAVAHEVQAVGARSIACLNSRDRNLLGLRRDLLTAAAYGVDSFLLVYGDDPTSGGRTSQLTVRTMIEEIRTFGAGPLFDAHPPFQVGVTSRLGPVPAWKMAADFLLAQVSYDLDQLLRWRDTLHFDGPVFAGVMVLASAAMARRVAETMPQIDVPQGLIQRLADDPGAGVEIACAQVEAVAASGAFDGVHLVPVGRFEEVAARLQRMGPPEPL